MKHAKIHYILLLIACLLANCLPAKADTTDDAQFKKKTLLIINSYNEQSLWSRDIVTPIALYASKDDNIHAELYALNNVLVTDSTKYLQVRDNLFATYRNHKPDYLMIIGSLAFSMRDQIVQEWGDIPILLITRDMSCAPADYYFSGYDNPIDDTIYPSLSDLRPKYNFTTIYVHDCYRETIDLMHELKPEMKELVFFSDPVYINRYLARNIEQYLYERYPDISFKWVKASDRHPNDIQYYFVHDMPNSGLLMSTWYFEKRNAFGYPSLSSGDIGLINSSINPMFCLRESYINIGCVGGAFVNNDSIRSEIVRMVETMVSGKPMRDCKFITNRHDVYNVINYPKFHEYDLSTAHCPEGTVFVNRPLTIWQQYRWYFIGFALLLAMTIFFLVRYTRLQQREIKTLQRHRDFVDKMPVPYAKGKVVYNDRNEVFDVRPVASNQRFKELLKKNGSKENPARLFTHTFVAEKCKELILTHKPVSFRYHFDKTDTYFIFTFCFVDSMSINDFKQIEEIDVFAIDVTQRLRAQNALKLTTYKLDLTLNAAKLIPWELRLDVNQLVIESETLFSRKLHRITEDGLENPDVKLIDFYDHISKIHPDDREAVLICVQEIRERRRTSFKLEYRVAITRDSEEVYEWLESNGTVTTRDDDGNPLIISGSVGIITERKKQEIELIEAREKALESDKLKSAFLANMSHEIRTPLNAIVGFSSLLGETDDINKRREFSSIINQNSDMLLSLVNDVLDLSRIESNTLELVDSDVDLNELIPVVCDTARMRLHKDVTLSFLPSQPSCVITIDGNRLSQVLMNLLTNAAKFTTRGSITVGYDIIDEKEIYFYVKDTGIGVSSENQGRLFHRFDKINNFMPGNGLGLSICKSIVELMGGTIGMKSRGEGKGSTFWFSLPYRPVDNDTPAPAPVEEQAPDAHAPSHPLDTEVPHAWVDADVVVREALAEQYANPVPDPVEQYQPQARTEKVILVAEDIEGNYMLLEHIIPKEYRVVHAWDGQEAVELFSRTQPDIILMDISMPIMDGYKATEEIRKLSKTVPIVAVTAFAYASDRKRILKSGFNDYLSKPVMRDDLLEVLKRYL